MRGLFSRKLKDFADVTKKKSKLSLVDRLINTLPENNETMDISAVALSNIENQLFT